LRETPEKPVVVGRGHGEDLTREERQTRRATLAPAGRGLHGRGGRCIGSAPGPLSLLVTRVADQRMSIRNRVPRSRSTIVAVPEAWAYHPVPPVMAKVASPSGPRLLKVNSPCIAI
jgi:hypothetical protein